MGNLLDHPSLGTSWVRIAEGYRQVEYSHPEPGVTAVATIAVAAFERTSAAAKASTDR